MRLGLDSSSRKVSMTHYGLATLTPARPDRNGNGPVPAYFFSVLQSGFLAHACSMPACLHQNFKGSLKEHLFLDYHILTCFSPASSLFSVHTNVPSSFLQNSGANKQALSRNEQGNQTATRRKNKQGLVWFRCDLVEQVSV